MKNKNILVLGIGSNAKNIIDFLYQKEKNFDFLEIDNKKQFLNLSKTKTIWFNDFEFQKTKSDIEYHKKVLFNKANTLKNELRLYRHAIIVTDMGEEFVYDMIFEIIKYIEQFKIKHSVFAMYPPVLDETNINKKAVEIIGKLTIKGYSLGNNMFLYNSKEALREGNSNQANKASEILKMIFELRAKEIKSAV